MNTNQNTTQRETANSGNWKRTILISGAILLAGAAITYLIFSTEPAAQRTTTTKKTAMLVDVTTVESGTFRPTISAMGTVVPARDIILRPRVSGEVIDRSEDFTPGGFVEKGDTLLRLDPSDYRNALRQQKSELQQAIADLKIEMGRQDVARQEYDLLEEQLSSENRALVLRKPQLTAARSQVESGRAAVEQAELELQRTYITAPFDAHILSRNVNIGSQVSTGDNLGRLVGVRTYWVEATVPLSKLPWLAFPEDGDTSGATVHIRNRTAWPPDTYRRGHLFKLIGQLEEQTRMARVLVSVRDPLAHLQGTADLPPLMIGTYVESKIRTKPVSGVVRLNRDYVRKNDTVWIMEDGKLQIRNVDIVFSDPRYAYIRDGLAQGERVVTSNLATVVEGARLRLDGTGTAGADTSSAQTVARDTGKTALATGGGS